MKIKLTLILAFCLMFFSLNLQGQDKIELLNDIDSLEGHELYDKLQDYSFAKYFNDLHRRNKANNRFTNSEVLALYWNALNKVIQLKPKSRDDRFTITDFIHELLYDLLYKYGNTEYAKLTSLYKSLPETSWLRGEAFLIPMYQYQVYKEIENAITKKLKPYSIIGLPKNLTPTVLSNSKNRTANDCKELFSSIRAHYKQRVLVDTSCGWYSFDSNKPLFYKTIEKILFESSVQDLKELNKFRLGATCGTGEYFYSKHGLVQLLILLRERDYLSVIGSRNYYSYPFLYEKIKVKLLELCDIDWIDYYTGKILAGKLNSIPSTFTKGGSDKAALKLLEIRDSIKHKGWYITKCSEFINPSQEKESSDSYSPYNNEFLQRYESNLTLKTVPVNDKLKKILKNEIIKTSLNADEFYLCQSAILALRNLDFDEEVKQTFIFFTDSKYSMIRYNAVHILKRNGVSVELPIDDGKIKYRFLVDGKPLKQDKIRWELYSDSKSHRSFLNGSEKTNENGILLITSDTILDHLEKIKKIAFYSDKHYGGGKDAMFYVESNIPKSLHDTTIINISTAKISIGLNLNRDAEFYKNKKMTINAFPSKLSMLKYETDIKEEFEFPVRFQKNIRCSFSAYIPGALEWFGFYTIKGDSLIDLQLENGVDIVFKLFAPGESNADKRVLFWLEKIDRSWSESFYYDYSLGGYESLPIGEYKLIISSSEEKKSRNQNKENECVEIISEDYPDYEGKIVQFTITEDSPVQINLGTIKLDAVKK